MKKKQTIKKQPDKKITQEQFDSLMSSLLEVPPQPKKKVISEK